MDPRLACPFPRHARGVALALALVAFLPLAARAAEGPAWHGRMPVRWTFARLAAAPAAHVRVALDPETGVLGPLTAADAERFALALPRPEGAEPLHVRQLPDGSLLLDLRERFMADYVVVRGADGRLRVQCNDDPRERARELAGDAAHAAWPER
jgi:hypothetical protein